MRTAWPAGAGPRCPGAGARPPPAAPRSPPGPGRRPSPPRSAATEAASAPGSGPVVTRFATLDRLPTSLDTPPHAPSTGAQPPMWTASGACSAALGLPITRPSALRSAPIGLHHGPPQPGSPTARPAVSPPSPRHRLAPVGSGTPGTPPRPSPLSSRPPTARADPWARIRTPGFGFWVLILDFGIENWVLGGPRRVSRVSRNHP